MPEHNYAVFDMERGEPPFARLPHQLNAGGRAPDANLEHLGSGGQVALSSLWKDGLAVP